MEKLKGFLVGILLMIIIVSCALQYVHVEIEKMFPGSALCQVLYSRVSDSFNERTASIVKIAFKILSFPIRILQVITYKDGSIVIESLDNKPLTRVGAIN